MNDKFLSLIGIARRAGKLSLGFDAVKEAAEKRKAHAVFGACDLSERTGRELARICSKSSIPFYSIPYTINQLSAAVGRPAGTAAVADSGFARRAAELLSEFEEETPYDD